MTKRSPGPDWAVMREPSSDDDGESQEDELGSLTLKRRGLISGHRSNSKRRRLSSPDENGVGSSSKVAYKTSRPEGSGQPVAGPSRPATTIPPRVTQPGQGSHRVQTARKYIASPFQTNRGKERDELVTSPPASLSPPPPRSTLKVNGSGKASAGQVNGKERGSRDLPKPLPKPSSTTSSRPKPVELRSSPDVIEISSDDDDVPPPAKPPAKKRVASYQGPPSSINIPKQIKRPVPQARRTLPAAKAEQEVIIIDDSDEELPQAAKQKATSSVLARPSVFDAAKRKKSKDRLRDSSPELQMSFRPIQPSRQQAFSGEPRRAAPNAEMQKDPEDQFTRDPSPELQTNVTASTQKPIRYVTTKSSLTHSQAMLPPPAAPSAPPHSTGSMQPSTSKSMLEKTSQSLPEKRPPSRLPVPDESRTPKQPSTTISTTASAPITSEKAPVWLAKPPPAKIPLPGRNRHSISGASIPEPPKSPAMAQPTSSSTMRQPKSPEPSSQTKGEPVTPSRVPIPPSPSRRSSGMDMSGLKDVLDSTVPLSTSQSAPSKRPPMPGKQASQLPSSPLSKAGPRLTVSDLFASTGPRVPPPKPKGPISASTGINGKQKQSPASSSSSRAPSSLGAPSQAPQSKLSHLAADVIDLTGDDSDEEMAPPSPPRSLDEALKSSEFLKRLLADAKTSQEASSASLSRDEGSRAATDELALPPLKDSLSGPATAAAVSKTLTTTVPRPLPLPTPRVSLPGRVPKLDPTLAVMTPSTEGAKPAKPLASSMPSQDSQQPNAPAAVEDAGKENRPSSSPESSSSSRLADRPPAPSSQVNLPHRSARKSGLRVPSWTRPPPDPSPVAPQLLDQTITPIPLITPVNTPLPVAVTPAATPPQPPTESPKPATNESEPSSQETAQASMFLDVPLAPTTPDQLPLMASSSAERDLPVAAVDATEVVLEEAAIPGVAKPLAALEDDSDSDLEYVDAPLPEPVNEEPSNEDTSEMMDVEQFLASPAPMSRESVLQEESPDPLDAAAVTEVLERPRRSTRSSRSASDEPLNFFPDDSSIDTPAETPSPSPAPEDPSIPVPLKTFGGFPSLNWRSYRQNLENFKAKCYLSKDLPHSLQDNINRWSEVTRQHPTVAYVLQSAIQENTADDEPDAPPIDIVNEVDNDPTPPWEFHYSNKMWHGEGVPPPDVTQLVSCNCMGKCDPKSKTCACLKRQQSHTLEAGCPDFVYDTRGRLKISDYPIFECNDLCGCGDECRNRVVQHGRTCALRIQKTDEKGWGVFAGNRKIPAGTFIGIYAGELLTDREGEARGITYNKFGRTYLFDLDFHHLKQGNPDWVVQYTVDAYHAGNFTRFLNHSCDPNCQLVSCYVNESDIQKPLLTVFAKRDIEPLEELCFSYSGDSHDDDDDDNGDEEEDSTSPLGDKAAVYAKCACKAPKCTGYMFR